MRTVTVAEEAIAGIRSFQDAVRDRPELAARLGQAHAFYVLDEESEDPEFGFSKWVGYANLTADEYLAEYKKLDGRNTEYALARWFDEVRHGSPLYRSLLLKLEAWLAAYGKRPRQGDAQKTRLMILKPEFRRSGGGEDRRLLELMLAVAETLPPSQRHELRAAL